MQTENLLFDDCCKRQVVKELSELLPDLSIAVLSKTLIVEAIDLCNLATFVIASEDREPFREPYFECNEQSHSLYRVISSVNVITHEQVVSLRWLSTNLEELTEIMELSVDITTNGHWSWHCLHV